ncbi:Interleukin enhancer-binding factor 2 -like protein [Halotydeus destructor]|nr:Interleukin enhancer-binding factor 2 -like protein [Halotydeus destructor]
MNPIAAVETQPRPPFDVNLVDEYFVKVSPQNDLENNLTQAVLKRNGELTPSPTDQAELVNLLSKVQIVLENLALSAASFKACVIEEIRQVGSFKKGTLLIKNLRADLVVILGTLPFIESVKALSSRVREDLIQLDPSLSKITATVTESGFDLEHDAQEITVQVLVTTVIPNLRRIDNVVHIPKRILQRNMAAIRHVRWFEEAANSTTIKVLVRVMKDVRKRHAGFHCLNPWTIDVLAHYAVTFRNTEQLIPLGAAFKRIFQLLAAGLFLPGSTGIPDPCDNAGQSVHQSLSLVQQDVVCMTAQTLLRVLVHQEGYLVVLGLKPDPVETSGGLLKNTTVWGDVVVVPSNAAYEPGYWKSRCENSNPIAANEDEKMDQTATSQTV